MIHMMINQLGGAPYPDYLYECGDNHNAGEAAHWYVDDLSFLIGFGCSWTAGLA